MENDGYKIYTVLVEYNSRTGLPTGRTKPNIPSDPDYRAPVIDLTLCPLPGAPVVPTMNVIVEIDSGFVFEVRLQYDTNYLTRTTAGTWNIVDRLYDGIFFEITAKTAIDYQIKIEYGVGNYRAVNVTGLGTYFIPGPFTDITKISILSLDGDFNGDYGGDYF